MGPFNKAKVINISFVYLLYYILIVKSQLQDKPQLRQHVKYTSEKESLVLRRAVYLF